MDGYGSSCLALFTTSYLTGFGINFLSEMRTILLFIILCSFLQSRADCGCDVVLPKHPSGGIYFINGVTNGITIKPGDKVCIKADTYSNIYLRGIIGTPDKPITIINCGGLVRVGDSPSWNISIANCRYFRLTGSGDPNIKYGIKVNWPGGWSSTGIGVGDSCTDYEIDHYEAQNVSNGFICKINPTDCEPGTWGQNWTVKNIRLHDNYIHNTVGEAFYIMNHAATVDVKDCSTGNTITVEPVGAIDVKIYNNIVDSAGWDGIQLVKAIDAEIYNNRVTNFGLGNVSGQYYGIILGGKSIGKVYNNFIANGTGPGLALTGFNENSAYNNVIANVGDIGITVDDRPMPNNEYINFRVNLFNNNVVNAGYGIRLLNGFGTMAPGSRIYNNLIVAPRQPDTRYINAFIVLNDISLVDTAYNLYIRKIEDAGFVNPSDLDFHLLPHSPAVNSGMDISGYGVTDDLDHLKRPQGGAFDIGAYESSYVLSIDTTDTRFERPTYSKLQLSIITNGNEIICRIESDQVQHVKLSIYNIIGQLIQTESKVVKKGMNYLYLKRPDMHGISIFKMSTYFGYITKKIVL